MIHTVDKCYNVITIIMNIFPCGSLDFGITVFDGRYKVRLWIKPFESLARTCLLLGAREIGIVNVGKKRILWDSPFRKWKNNNNKPLYFQYTETFLYLLEPIIAFSQLKSWKVWLGFVSRVNIKILIWIISRVDVFSKNGSNRIKLSVWLIAPLKGCLLQTFIKCFSGPSYIRSFD